MRAPDTTNLDNSDVCANLSRSNGNTVGGNQAKYESNLHWKLYIRCGPW